MEQVFVDTSAWYAYADTTDSNHAAVINALEKWDGRLITSNFVFDEILTLLTARASYSIAVRTGAILRESGVVRMIRIASEDEEEAWSLFQRQSDKGYSFTDCTSFVLMRRLGLHTAITLDAHFLQAGFSVLPSNDSWVREGLPGYVPQKSGSELKKSKKKVLRKP